MYEEIYLESDEEVTSAVEKVKKSKKRNIALCLPRNAVLGQSIVNLKLIFKEAAAEGKEVGLVSPDTTTRNLAQRIGFSVFPSVKEIDFPRGKELDNEPKPKKPTVKEDPPIDDGDEEPDEKDAVAGGDLASAGFTSHAVESSPPIEEPVDMNDKKEVAEEAPKKEQASEHSDIGKGGMIPTRGNLRFFRQKKRRAIILPILVVLGILIAGGLAAILYVPSATLKVVVFAQPLNSSVKSSVDTEATAMDGDKSVIPGKVIAVTQETKSTAKSTGKKDIGTKTKGTLTLTNEWDSQVHSFAAGTRVRAKGGTEYVLTSAVNVPGASSSVVGGKAVVTGGKKDAEVEAIEAGDTYNIAATSFILPNIPTAQQEKIYGTSSTAFTGGKSNVVTVVTQSDIDKLTAAIKAQNLDEATKQIKAQGTDEVIILDKAMQTLSQDVTTSVVADAQNDSVEGTVTGKFQVISFNKSDQNSLMEKLLANQIPQGQKIVKQGNDLVTDLTQFELNNVTDKRLDLTNNLKAFTITQFSEEELKRDMIGITPTDALGLLKKKIPADSVDIQKTPSWWPRLPFNGSRINLEFSYKAKEETPPAE